jgi:O-antigen/teichoic acid export membrane protein
VKRFFKSKPTLKAVSHQGRGVEKEEIRVQYSGLIIFAAQLISIATGLAFTLLLTRNLPQEEFGTYTFMFDLIAYFTIFSGLLPFWAVRFIARGKEGVTKTVVASNLVISLISITLYFILLLPAATVLHVNSVFVIFYAVASVHIINVHLLNSLQSILQARKPQATGIGLLVSEFPKVGFAYVIAFVSGQVYLGALLGFLIGEILQTVYYVKLVSPDFNQRMHWNYVREWAKGSTVVIFGLVGGLLANLVFSLLFLYGGGAARANYQAAAQFAAVIGYSSVLAFALYPKLIAQDCFEEVAASLKLMLMFALPMTVLAMVMAPSLLTILDVSYSSAAMVLVALAADALVIVLLNFYQFVLMGSEKLDEEAKIHLGTLVRSKIFRVNGLNYVQAAISIPLAFYVLTAFSAEPDQIAFYFATIMLVTHIVLFGIVYVWTIKSCRVTVPWVSVSKYLFASAISGFVIFLLPRPTKLTLTFATLLVGVGIYAAILLLVDKYARNLLLEVVRQVPEFLRHKDARNK